MDNPWLSLPVALIIAALVTVGTLTLFTTGPTEAMAQEDSQLPEGIANTFCCVFWTCLISLFF